jgi:hypothetical protein
MGEGAGGGEQKEFIGLFRVIGSVLQCIQGSSFIISNQEKAEVIKQFTKVVVNSVNEIPDDWMSIIPYSKEGAQETKKCFEIVSGKSNKKELPKDDIEEIIKIKSDSKMSPEVNLEVKPETRPDPKPKELDWHETKSGRPMPSLRFVR